MLPGSDLGNCNVKRVRLSLLVFFFKDWKGDGDDVNEGERKKKRGSSEFRNSKKKYYKKVNDSIVMKSKR